MTPAILEVAAHSLAAVLGIWLGLTVLTRAASPASRVFALLSLSVATWSSSIIVQRVSISATAGTAGHFVEELMAALAIAATAHFSLAIGTESGPSSASVITRVLRIIQAPTTIGHVSTELHRDTRQRARLTRQGQITVPKAVRDALGARPGDEIEFMRQGDGFVVDVRPRRSVLDFAGVAAHAAPHVPATAEDLDVLVERGMTDAAVARERRTRSRSRQTP